MSRASVTARLAITALLLANNLSDLASPSTARGNLGLGGAAVLNVGTTAGTVMAGDDGRIAGAALKANNLSDLANAGTARTNLGLGTMAVINSPVPVANGGTAATSASGTALDNITGFSGTGFLKRTGAGAYSFIADPLPAANGGTGKAVYVLGDILYADSTTTLARLADVATGNALIAGGVGAAPSWGKIGLTTHISGVLAEANGGTNQSTYTTGDLLQATAGNTLGKLAAVATGNVLTSGGVGVASSWGKVGLTTHVTGVLPEANGGTNQSSYTTGDLIQASAANTLSKLPAVATGNALISGGVGVASSWGKVGLTTHVSGVLPVANGGTNASSASGTALDNITGFASTGFLKRTGAGAYSFVADPLPAANGGTGQAVYVLGDILYADSTTTLARLADVATGNALIAGGVGAAPSWGKIGLTTHISGVLAEANGGTNQSTYAAGDLLQATGSNALGKLAAVATGNVLISGGVGTASSWGKVGLTTHVSGTLPVANGGTNATTAAGALSNLGAVGKQTLWVPAGAMTPAATNGPAAGSAVAATNVNNFSTLDFDTSTQEIAWCSVAMPKQWDEGTVTFKPVFSQLTTAAGGVVFDLAGAACSDGDTIDVAMGTAQTSVKTAGTLNTLYVGPESSAITIAGSPAAGDWVQFRVRRVPADASDTLAQDARLHGIILYITNDTGNDA